MAGQRTLSADEIMKMTPAELEQYRASLPTPTKEDWGDSPTWRNWFNAFNATMDRVAISDESKDHIRLIFITELSNEIPPRKVVNPRMRVPATGVNFSSCMNMLNMEAKNIPKADTPLGKIVAEAIKRSQQVYGEYVHGHRAPTAPALDTSAVKVGT